MKPQASKDFAFLTLIIEETHDSILNQMIIYHNEKVRVSITK